MKKTALVLILVTLFFSCSNTTQTFLYHQLGFNNDWKFIEADIADAYKPKFNDTDWRTVDLPHDWSVEDFTVQDSSHVGPFFKDQAGGPDVGYLRGGTGWYRKVWTIPTEDKDKQVYIHFDGVQTLADVYVNGRFADKHVYGYTPFKINITPFLNDSGQENLIAVKVVNPENNSRWFAGAGIYRGVSISYVDPVHIDDWGVAVRTLGINQDNAGLAINVNVINTRTSEQIVNVDISLLSPNGQVQKLPIKSMTLAANDTTAFTMLAQVPAPMLWSTDSPDLYRAEIRIIKEENVLDVWSTFFGIRTIKFSAEQGFLLNGQPVLMKGACMHHDNGLLGAAAFQRAEERRVAIMKQNGFNAIRTSHNPPSKHFLDACDRLGMLVIDESFDHWHKAKRSNDYSNYYQESWQSDTKSMVLRDRNHPSVIMWSIGNEIQERADASGLQIARAAADYIKSIDDTRPITEAICGFWDNPHLQWDDSAPAFAILDVGGYNYQWKRYESDHEKYPNRIMYGSETIPGEAWQNWEKVAKLPYVIGDFVWTGMDYIGESGIGHTIYQTDKNAPKAFLMPWPYYVSWCGDIDIIGNKKPQSWFRDVVWDERKIAMAVHSPIPDGAKEIVSFWGWPNEYNHWNWDVPEGTPMQVSVFSACPLVQLQLNGEIIAEQEITDQDSLRTTLTIPWFPGELKANAILDGKIVESCVFQTAGEVADIVLKPERKRITADKGEVIYIPVSVQDVQGVLLPVSEFSLQVKVTGPGTLLAAGNGSPEIDGSMQDDEFSLFRGKGLIIIRATGDKGKITVTVNSKDNNKLHKQVAIRAF